MRQTVTLDVADVSTAILARFPKTRPKLPSAYEAIYREHYLRNRGGRSYASALSRAAESWMHRRVAADANRSLKPGAVLEIGAGTLNHLEYERHSEPYDIIEPSAYLYEGVSILPRIRHIYADIRDIPLAPRYSRIISIATFEHLCDLPEVTARSAMLLEDGGTLRVAIPSEGTNFWQWAQDLTTGLEFRLKYRLDYGVLRRFDHVNMADEIEQVLNHFFASVTARVFGWSRRWSIYQCFTCAAPRLTASRDYLAELPRSSA